MDISIKKQEIFGPKTNYVGAQQLGDQKEIAPPIVEGKTERDNSFKNLVKTVDQLNKWLLESESTHLQFRLHDQLKEYYVEVINDETNEVIRQIPSKKILDFAAKMHEMIGLLVDEKR